MSASLPERRLRVRGDENPIAKAGWPFAGIALAFSALSLFISIFVFIPAVLFLAFTLYFFRNPKRANPVDQDLIVSPADGRVIAIETLEEVRFLKRPCRRVSIFMSPFNVHVNRMPFDGEVANVHYNSGKYLPAYREKASLDNEQNAVHLRTPNGEDLVFVQIAGFIARRIVCDAMPNDVFVRGERYGLIRFGSRMDLYLPLSATILTKVGDTVSGGTTPLARW